MHDTTLHTLYNWGKRIRVFIKYWFLFSVKGGWGKPILVSLDHCVSDPNGQVQRIKKCDSPTPKYGGEPCQGSNIDFVPCRQTNYKGNLLKFRKVDILYLLLYLRHIFLRYIFYSNQGLGITTCNMVPGELSYTDEYYLGTTETDYQCVQEVKKRADSELPGEKADGMLWTTNTHECWAKYGSSNSSVNPDGCKYCKSCSFGNILLDFKFLYN